MTTVSQDKYFIDSVISKSLLDDSIDWIRRNLSPEEVFTEYELRDWAKREGLVEPE